MLQRTKDYVLLLLLIVTGMASQVSHRTLNYKERTELVQQLRQTKTAFLQSVKNLSPAQLQFSPSSKEATLSQYLHYAALQEDSLWAQAFQALNQNTQAAEKPKESMGILKSWEGSKNAQAVNVVPLKPNQIQDVLAAFKKDRSNIIKYVKTTTADVRSHTLQMGEGTIDAYDLLLQIPAHTAWCTAQIEKYKAHPRFPK